VWWAAAVARALQAIANADGDPAADGFFLNSWSLQQERVDKASSRTAQMKE